MTNSELFKKAHEEARKIVSIVGDYKVAFSYALKTLYKEATKVETYEILFSSILVTFFLSFFTEVQTEIVAFAVFVTVKLFAKIVKKVLAFKVQPNYNEYIR